MTVVSGLRNKAAEGAGVHTVNPGTWLSCTSPFWPKDGRPASRNLGRSNRGARRSGRHAISVAGALHRGQSRERRGVQHRVRLRLRIDDLVPPARSRCRWSTTLASSSTACSAKAIRLKSARRSSRRRTACSISWPRSVVGARQARPRRPSAHGGVSRFGARDRAPSAEDGRSGLLEARSARRAGRRAAGLRRPHQADVRSRRARVSSRAHAHCVVHDGGRDQHAHVQPGRHLGGVPSAVAPPEQRRTSWRGSRSCRRITRRCSRGSSRSWRRRPTATARCSITRSCSTAAT